MIRVTCISRSTIRTATFLAILVGLTLASGACAGPEGGAQAMAESSYATLGFGSSTPGGSGRHLSPPDTNVLRVTTLTDSGPGSLRACIDSPRPRTCTFEVSGEIRLQTPLRARAPYLTIAGRTAPSPGITLTGSSLKLESHDIIVEHIAIRPGDHPANDKPAERDAISIGSDKPPGAYNIIVDHVSATWAIDETISLWYPSTHDVTIANSLIAEGLNDSIHPKGPHSKGLMIGNGVSRVTLMRNLIALNVERNPYLKPGSSAELLNNVVYGWGGAGGWCRCNLSDNDGSREPVQLIFEGNYYKPGPDSFAGAPIYAKNPSPETRIFVRDNYDPVSGGVATNPWSVVMLPESPYRAVTPPFTPSGAERLPLSITYDTVLDTVGSRPWERSAEDQRVINHVRNGTGGIRDCVQGCRRNGLM